MAIYKDKKRGTYYFVTRLNGKQYKRRGFQTKKEAKRAEALFDTEEAKENETILFKDICEQYLSWYGKRRKISSYNKTAGVINMQLIPQFGDTDIKAIRSKNIMDYQDVLIDQYSVNHAKKIHQVLSAVFNFAVKRGDTNNNPARDAGNIDIEPNQHINYWTLEEFKQFMAVVDDDFYRTLFMTLYYSGLRKGELMALTWNDVDFDNNTLSVDKTVYQGVVTTPKTTSSIRTIEMPNMVMNMLQQLRNIVRPKNNYIVFGSFYDYLSTTTLDRKFYKWINEAGVKRIRIHDFRHSHASYLINKNAVISLVANRLGHKDKAVTLNTYSHLYPDTEKEIVSWMEDDFKSAKIYDLK